MLGGILGPGRQDTSCMMQVLVVYLPIAVAGWCLHDEKKFDDAVLADRSGTDCLVYCLSVVPFCRWGRESECGCIASTSWCSLSLLHTAPHLARVAALPTSHHRAQPPSHESTHPANPFATMHVYVHHAPPPMPTPAGRRATHAPTHLVDDGPRRQPRPRPLSREALPQHHPQAEDVHRARDAARLGPEAFRGHVRNSASLQVLCSTQAQR